MRTLLQQLYNGEIRPSEEIAAKSTEYKDLRRKIMDDRKYFSSVLSAEDNKRFDNLSDLELQRSADYAFENFLYGFRLGVKLMIEAAGTTAVDTKE